MVATRAVAVDMTAADTAAAVAADTAAVVAAAVAADTAAVTAADTVAVVAAMAVAAAAITAVAPTTTFPSSVQLSLSLDCRADADRSKMPCSHRQVALRRHSRPRRDRVVVIRACGLADPGRR